MNKLKFSSSETTRETLKYLQKQKNNYKLENLESLKCLNFNFKEYLKYGTPEHIPNPNIDFLEWLIGFFEAEGYFCNWFDGKQQRFQIEINQKDPQLMYKIKKNLGFGNVTQFSKNKEFYWRYSTSSFINIKRLIFLFNGNFITAHKASMLYNFIEHFNRVYNTFIIILKCNIQPSLKSYWLSGFLEGDGGFWATQPENLNLNKKKLNTGLVIKFYITQKNELILLNKIKNLFKIPNKIYKTHNGNTLQKYNRLETCNLESLKSIKTYLQSYPFLGKRQILIKRWIRLIDYKLNDYPFTSKSNKKLKRLVLSTKKS